MAKSAIIGALRVNLGIDSAQFSSGLSNAQSRLDKFGAAAVRGFAVVATASAAMGAALAVGVKSTIDNADELSKASQQYGIATGELSKMKYAADLAGVSFETLTKGTGRLARNMLDAEMGLKAPQRAFDALEISIRNADGTLKSASQIMTEVADRFSRMEDGTEKTALAMNIFGRAGAELIPLLNAGSKGLAEMMAEAERLGIVIDTQTGRAAEEFNDNLTRLNATKDGLITKITVGLLPSLEKLSEMMVDLANDESRVSEIATKVGNVFHWVARQTATVVGGIAGIKAEINGLIEAATRLNNYDFSGALNAWNSGQMEAQRIREDMIAAVDAIFDGNSFSQAQIQRRIDDAFGTAGAGAADKFVTRFEAGAGGKIKQAIDPMVREAAQIFDATRTPLENYQMDIARLNELLAAGAVDQDTYNRAVLHAQDAFDKASEGAENGLKSLQRVGQTVGQTLAGVFETLFDKTKSFGESILDAGKRLASMALSSAFQSFFGNLFGGSGGGSFNPTRGGFAAMLGLPSYAGGGHTGFGSRSGGLDGMGGFQAILHPNETVVDHTKSGGGTGGTVDARVYNIDARGAQRGVGEEIRKALADYDSTLPNKVHGKIASVQQNPRGVTGRW